MAQKADLIADNLQFAESPRWHDGRLWFSDFYDHAVRSVSLSGDLRTEFAIDDQPSGLGWRPDGTLLVVSMTQRSLLLHSTSGVTSMWADLGQIATYDCNDMVVDSKGGAYVGNFGFDLRSDLAARGLDAVLADHPTARLMYVSPEGSPRVVAEDLHFPNGCVILPGHETLIVAETLSAALTAFDIEGDGSLSNRRLWASLWPRLPDGIALDADGAVWVANPRATECVRIKEGGVVLDRIETVHPCYACALGGEDGRTLFMLTAEISDQERVPTARSGRIWAASVQHGRSGWP
jgi:sugar lactone lactonase YvrE